MSIAILCPTLNRPDQLSRMIRSVNGVATVYIDDRSMMPTVQKWNELAVKAMESPEHKLFMLGSDDIIFDTPGWDKALLDHYNALENKIHVYHLLDSRDPSGTPHPLVTREYIEAMGYFIPPVFLHWFSDTWTVDIAKYNAVFSHIVDFRLVHDKPSDTGAGDETHNRIRQWDWHGRDKWVNDHCQHFLNLEKDRLAAQLPFIDEFGNRGKRHFFVEPGVYVSAKVYEENSSWCFPSNYKKCTVETQGGGS